MNTGPVLVDVAVKDLSGAALDWAVAQADGYPVKLVPAVLDAGWFVWSTDVSEGGRYSPSTDWSQGGPLIAKYLMDFCVEHPQTIGAALCDENGLYIGDCMAFGPTHLIAACRALVLVKLGDIVKVPHCLVTP